MIVRFHKDFEKRYAKLPVKLQRKTEATVIIFQENPFDRRLKNHALRGTLLGKRAILVTGSYRIVFEEFKKYTLVLMLDIGTHQQVYGE